MPTLEGLLYKQLRAKFGPDVTITFKYEINLDGLLFEVSQKVGDKVKSASNAVTGLEELQNGTDALLEDFIDCRVNQVYREFEALK